MHRCTSLILPPCTENPGGRVFAVICYIIALLQNPDSISLRDYHRTLCSSKLLLLLLLLHPFNGLFSRTTWVSRYQKGKTSLDLNEARDGGVLGWQWHQLDHIQTICTSLQTDNHTNTSSVDVYRLDALPDAQPVSKH